MEIIDQTMKKYKLKAGDIASVGFMYHSPGNTELGMFENANIIKVLVNNTSLSNIKNMMILFYLHD